METCVYYTLSKVSTFPEVETVETYGIFGTSVIFVKFPLPRSFSSPSLIRPAIILLIVVWL